MKKNLLIKLKVFLGCSITPIYLTDFEELAINDTRVKPNKRDKAGIARLDYLLMNNIWIAGEIYNIFSKEAVYELNFR